MTVCALLLRLLLPSSPAALSVSLTWLVKPALLPHCSLPGTEMEIAENNVGDQISRYIVKWQLSRWDGKMNLITEDRS